MQIGLKNKPNLEHAAMNKWCTSVGALICVIATVVCLAPFATKAFHIDDTLFLYAARQISVHPADPYGFTVNWYSYESRMSDVTQNGPLTSYYIALAASILGWSEIALHLAFLVPAVAAVLGTYFLAARFCTQPLIAALATLLCPAFLVSSTTVMTDTMMLALWVWAMLFWLRNIEKGSHALLIISACLIGLAAIAKYFAFALIPLLLFHGLLCWPRVRWRILYLAIPVIICLLYDFAMRSMYGHSMLYGAGTYALTQSTHSSYFSRLLITLSFTGGCLTTLIFYAPLIWPRRVLMIAGLGILLTVLYLSSTNSLTDFDLPSGGIRVLIVLQFTVFAAAGIGLVALSALDFWRSRDADTFLLVQWIAGTMVFCWLVNWTVNGRSILPMAPAVSILIVRHIGSYAKNIKGWTIHMEYLPLVLSGLMSIAVVWADARFANTGRAAAAEMQRRYADHKGTVLFSGHWGFQYYMESYGFTAIDANKTTMSRNDILVLPGFGSNTAKIPKGIFSKTTRLEFQQCSFLTTMSNLFKAGFYSSACGPLPYAFGAVPAERFYLLMKPIGTEELARIKSFEEEVERNPKSAEPLVKLANALIQNGRFQEAIVDLKQVVRLDPNDANTHNNLAWLLATQKAEQLGDPFEAVLMAERACKLTEYKSVDCLDTLAVAYASAGRFSEAVVTAQKAIQIASAAGQAALVKQIEDRLKLYKENRAYIEPEE
jgi:hypothetical protein